MINSLKSTLKCPIGLSGNYAMSQNHCIDETKEYIIVNLTDAAYNAIEEYQHNKHAQRFNTEQCAKIQFQGTSGVIQFPTPGDGKGREFDFVIRDIESSLDCVQQTENHLDVLNSLVYRMRINANDDVYGKTLEKMVIAEEIVQKQRTLEIKPIYNKTFVPSSTLHGSSGAGPNRLVFCKTSGGGRISTSANTSQRNIRQRVRRLMGLRHCNKSAQLQVQDHAQHHQQQTHAVHSNHINSSASQQEQAPQSAPAALPGPQQIAAPAAAFAKVFTTAAPANDILKYTPIKTFEQRGLYKAEFEANYDEYLKLLLGIQKIGRRFQGLEQQLSNVPRESPEYYLIKQQILKVFELSQDEALQREKQRFDYLHKKLSYIKQLVTDYDTNPPRATQD